MPIDPEKAKQASFAPQERAYGPHDVILYHLGLGAGADPLDRNELEYTYEGDLKVLPTFALVLYPVDMAALTSIDGLEFDPRMLLHGEQDLIIHHPMPASATVTGQSRISDVYDKGKAAVAVMETETRDSAGELLCTSKGSMFLRGAGGFGGEPGPKVDYPVPDRAPDQVLEAPILPQQALLYRLNGDSNPLHADPAFAAGGGFQQPILHGLCTYGMVCKAAVDNVLGGDVTAVRRYSARFAGVVYPGETIVTSVWDQGDQILVNATTKRRGEPVLTHAVIDAKR